MRAVCECMFSVLKMHVDINIFIKTETKKETKTRDRDRDSNGGRDKTEMDTREASLSSELREQLDLCLQFGPGLFQLLVVRLVPCLIQSLCLA